MAWDSFEDFFRSATGLDPYPYQVLLATRKELPMLMNIPTGAGKTEAAILAWLWRRRFHSNTDVQRNTPRRFAYCLPMRTLVEQTKERAERLLTSLGMLNQPDNLTGIGLHILIGGEVDEDWVLCPERDAIIIGTQDMLLSRALNRGYGLSRFSWPISFGLLNDDCLWVMDEIQLMGTGLATSVQLAAFREGLGVIGNCPTVWMSATAQPEWLSTVDHSVPTPEQVLTIGSADVAAPVLARRLNARKILSKFEHTLPEKPAQIDGFVRNLAKQVVAEHESGTLTLVIVNTVKRAKALFDALTKEIRKSSTPDLLLIHSRYRPYERGQLNGILTATISRDGPGLIAVATQVVEAGVDISAKLLVTELAPWASLVQRFGRANRAAEFEQATVLWVDVPDKLAAPYESQAIRDARTTLLELEGKSVSPANLPDVEMAYALTHILRRRDLIGLFDTSPDLSGNDIDVSRFIRNDQDLDVQVFWRDFQGDPVNTLPLPERVELCPAPVGEVREFAKTVPLWRWDHLDGAWRRVKPEQILPGQVLLIRAADGGYSLRTGWDFEIRDLVPVVKGFEPTTLAEATSDDNATYTTRRWYTLAEHSDHVVREMERLIQALQSLDLEQLPSYLIQAARWHDLGKAHLVFQDTLLAGADPAERETQRGQVWAKSAGRRVRHARPHFRHELASALAVLAHSGSDLVAYLVAAHHGRIRLVLRSLPGEKKPAEPGQGANSCYALGIWDGDRLPMVEIGGGIIVPETVLDLSLMELGLTPQGQTSWASRMLILRDTKELGPFRLAYLESLLIAADRRASAQERGR